MIIDMVVLLTVLALASAQMRKPHADIEEDTRLSTIGLIEKYGYPVEVHTARTEDGYILEMHRISHSPASPPATDKPVAFLQHGFISYFLADQGYDVWMGNFRGNTYSKKHITLKPSDSEFWNFSWHELGIFDLPAQIDYVLEKVGQTDVFYIGYSQGTTASYVMTSERPEYNAKVKATLSLAPMGFMANLGDTPLGLLSKANFFLYMSEALGVHELLPSTPLFHELALKLCSDHKATQFICAIFLSAAIQPAQLNKTMIPVILGHIPAGAGIRQVIHYSQLINSGKFRQYDHGSEGNRMRYGKTTPPDYNLSRITCPVFLYYSEEDRWSRRKDVETLYAKLNYSSVKKMIHLKGFRHLDSLFAIDVRSLVNEKLLGHLRSFQRESNSTDLNDVGN